MKEQQIDEKLAQRSMAKSNHGDRLGIEIRSAKVSSVLQVYTKDFKWYINQKGHG